MMSPNAAKLHQTRLARLIEASLRTGRFNCPECFAAGPHESNGALGENQAFCCTVCGTHHDAHDVARLIEEGSIGGNL